MVTGETKTMVTGVTKTGFRFAVRKDSFADWKTMKALTKAQSDNVSQRCDGIVQLAEIILGSQEQTLYEHVKKTKGTASVENMMEEIIEIITAAQTEKTVKNY